MVELMQIFMKRKAELDFVLDRDRDEIQRMIDNDEDLSVPYVFNLWQQIDINSMALVNLQSELITKIVSSIEIR